MLKLSPNKIQQNLLEYLSKYLYLNTKQDGTITILSIVYDENLSNSPFAACTFKHTLNKKSKVTYYICLLDLIGLRVVGIPLKIGKKSAYIDYEFYDDGCGISNLILSHGRTDFYWDRTQNGKGFSLHEFIWDYKVSDIHKELLTTYAKWILEFLGKREMLLSLHLQVHKPLARTSLMNDYNYQIISIIEDLMKDVEELINNYPS